MFFPVNFTDNNSETVNGDGSANRVWKSGQSGVGLRLQEIDSGSSLKKYNDNRYMCYFIPLLVTGNYTLQFILF